MRRWANILRTAQRIEGRAREPLVRGRLRLVRWTPMMRGKIIEVLLLKIKVLWLMLTIIKAIIQKIVMKCHWRHNLKMLISKLKTCKIISGKDDSMNTRINRRPVAPKLSRMSSSYWTRNTPGWKSSSMTWRERKIWLLWDSKTSLRITMSLYWSAH